MNRSDKCLMCVVLFLMIMAEIVFDFFNQQGAFVSPRNSKHLLTQVNKNDNVALSSVAFCFEQNTYDCLCDSLSVS
ncbi:MULTISPECIES: hypothetical protein [Erysipelothrix]|uniref:Uncharacterized protein n=1 Tax=Erysipelothrix piscisicarius TaxID=2485784 RepID=A0A3S8RP47_9FIRM|nr:MULTISPECIES: hypothetical protein [Erysipelothrix]AZK44639.1 hypothetical protein EEI45_07800 [Erysipelothrix piscisicarius]MBK2402970.1 hypothetical protein [Erysipelothrix sp. strain 2 (EsS2-6-Brazil)]MBK2404181.1 hypothetical protein [Erysipelothrix sp. strain 2 (EsS2-7-Brazil)]NBA01019.1 hypothetical protein [Erysipelothrix rhusiopathiae]